MFDSSKDIIAKACRVLDGQALNEFSFDPEMGESTFKFDLGGTLTTGPYDEDLLEQWLLYCPDGCVLTYRSDGAFSHGRGNEVREKVFSRVTSI